MTKELFIETILQMERQHTYDIQCNKSFAVILPNDHISGYDNHLLQDQLIKLLSVVIEDSLNWIEYFIYELDYGKKWKRTSVSIEGKSFKLKTPSDLWHLITNGR